MSDTEEDQEHPPVGSGENPDVGGIEDAPGGQSRPTPAGGGQDSGGAAHTSADQGHPAGDGPRSDRDVGGPTPAEDAETSSGTEGGVKGDIQTKGFDSHE
jgi:hypothetical protein